MMECPDCFYAQYDPHHVCADCGYPICPECEVTYSCDHGMEEMTDDEPLRKRFKYGGLIGPPMVMCEGCDMHACVSCYLEHAIYLDGTNFTPQTAYRYSKDVQQDALTLFMVNERMDPKVRLPLEMLLEIIKHL